MDENRKDYLPGNGGYFMNDVTLLAKKYVDNVVKSGVQVSDAILFGSWARDNAKPESDIDICIVSPQLGKDLISEIVKLRQLSFNIDNRIEPMPMAPEDMIDKFNPLANEINKYGIKLQ